MQTATIHLNEPGPEGQTELYFASIDGEHFLPVTRLPMEGEDSEVAELFEAHNGFVRMTWAPRGIRQVAQMENADVAWGEV